jgi:glutamyl-tRNA reductase
MSDIQEQIKLAHKRAEENDRTDTVSIQDLFNERIEQNKRVEELININEKLSLALESAENKLNLISQYIRSLPTFHIGYGKDEDDIEKIMYASEFNFVDEIISLLENGGK